MEDFAFFCLLWVQTKHHTGERFPILPAAPGAIKALGRNTQDDQVKTSDLPDRTSGKYIISTELTLAYWQLLVAKRWLSVWDGPEAAHGLSFVFCLIPTEYSLVNYVLAFAGDRFRIFAKCQKVCMDFLHRSWKLTHLKAGKNIGLPWYC